MKLVVKTDGRVENYSPEKLASSLQKTFLSLKMPDGQIEEFIKLTLKDFQNWQSNKPEITSADIRRQVGKILNNINPDAAYIFKNFKSII